MDAEIKKKFADLASRLSPENLFCDGEISRAQAMSKRGKIMSEWRQLEKRLEPFQ